MLTVWFYSVFGEKLSGKIKSLDRERYITATMTKKNVKQQIIFNLLELSDLGNLCYSILKKLARSSLNHYFCFLKLICVSYYHIDQINVY